MVHMECRRDYCDKKRIENLLYSRKVSLIHCAAHRIVWVTETGSESTTVFNECLFCGQGVSFDTKHTTSGNLEGLKVRTFEFQSTVTEMCHDRKDEWGTAVLGKINQCSVDLHAANAVYHRSCSKTTAWPVPLV